MQNNAIMFTPYEYEVMQDAGFMLAKRNLTEKVEAMLGNLQSELEMELSDKLDALRHQLGIELHGAKISKGENYMGLPYIVLDYPRHFDRGNVFALRSMFWWGNFFSFTVHIQGELWGKLKPKINISPLYYHELYLSSGDSPWEYHFEPSNYLLVSKENVEEALARCNQASFIKLSIKLPLQTPPEQLLKRGKEFYSDMMEMLGG